MLLAGIKRIEFASASSTESCWRKCVIRNNITIDTDSAQHPPSRQTGTDTLADAQPDCAGTGAASCGQRRAQSGLWLVQLPRGYRGKGSAELGDEIVNAPLLPISRDKSSPPAWCPNKQAERCVRRRVGRSLRASPEAGGLITALQPPRPPRRALAQVSPCLLAPAGPGPCHCHTWVLSPACVTARWSWVGNSHDGAVAHGKVRVMPGQSPHGPRGALWDHWGQRGWVWGRVARGQEVPWRPAQAAMGQGAQMGVSWVHPALWLCSKQGAAAPGMRLRRQRGRWHRVATATSLASPSLCLGAGCRRCQSQSWMDAGMEAAARLGSHQAPSADSRPGQAPAPPLRTRFARCPGHLLFPLTQNLRWKKQSRPKMHLPAPRSWHRLRAAGLAGGKSTGQHKSPEPPPRPPAAGPQECFATQVYK